MPHRHSHGANAVRYDKHSNRNQYHPKQNPTTTSDYAWNQNRQHQHHRHPPPPPPPPGSSESDDGQEVEFGVLPPLASSPRLKSTFDENGSLADSYMSSPDQRADHSLSSSQATPRQQNRSAHLVAMKTKQRTMKDEDASKNEAWYNSRRYLPYIVVAIIVLVGVVIAVVLLTGSNDNPNQGRKRRNPPSRNANDPNFILSLEHPVPFSLLHPVHDLGVWDFNTRPRSSTPTVVASIPRNYTDNTLKKVIPTNAWYQNLLLLHQNNEPVSSIHRVYTIPYMVDMAGPIPGIRVHVPTRVANATTVQLVVNDLQGLTLGATADARKTTSTTDESNIYSIVGTTHLSVTLLWNDNPSLQDVETYTMKSSLVRGMPYATMTYPAITTTTDKIPTIATQIALQESPLADEINTIDCSSQSATMVENDIEVTLENGTPWFIFFSRPVRIQCTPNEDSTGFLFQVVNDNGAPLTIRVAPITDISGNAFAYKALLKDRAPYYPGDQPRIEFDVRNDNEAVVGMDWNVLNMKSGEEYPLATEDERDFLIMFALPHHFDTIQEYEDLQICATSLYGPACLVGGASWTMLESLPRIAFQAPRSPDPDFVEALGNAVQDDLSFRVPENFRRGAGDTYYSGKMLAKLGRIVLIADELLRLCDSDADQKNYSSFCSRSNDIDITTALNHLKNDVQVWFNGKAEAPFVYDSAWGGIVSCGCDSDGITCLNRFPDCPAFLDDDFNFGNGFYNDQHFHYGYHIYAAAVVAHFDKAWGRKYFEQVLLMVRNIANPSEHDPAFPIFRHKDWYQGHSWASGVIEPKSYGRNQESSSEAIASYEAIALYGMAMVSAWEEMGEDGKAAIAEEIRKAGMVLTAMELRSAKRYWHVPRSVDSSLQVYPQGYQHSVVGIVWNSKVEFRTWFGNEPYKVYGIQLLPLTPIAEERDELDWAREMYVPFAHECNAADSCVEDGWSILELAILATLGHPELATNRALTSIPSDVYEKQAGNGHSLSNTLWYLATRPTVEEPFDLDSLGIELNCYQPKTCTNSVLDTIAGDFSCRDRIQWVIDSTGASQWDACTAIASVEFPEVCGLCDPMGQI